MKQEEVINELKIMNDTEFAIHQSNKKHNFKKVLKGINNPVTRFLILPFALPLMLLFVMFMALLAIIVFPYQFVIEGK